MNGYCEKCERCHDNGLRDDEDCPYYGEPDGCNHPTLGVDASTDLMRAALKPVLECDLAQDDRNLNCTLMRFHRAIREAQRIMREGGGK